MLTDGTHCRAPWKFINENSAIPSIIIPKHSCALASMFIDSYSALFKLVLKCHPAHPGHNPIMSSIFSGIDIPFVVCVIYWSLPTSGSPQEIAWNGPKLVYDCAVWAGAVVALILCPPHLGICFKLICIVFRGAAAGALILPGLQAGAAATNPPSAWASKQQSQNSVTVGDEDESLRSWNGEHGWTPWRAHAW